MKAHATRILISLALGTMTAVAVAWSCLNVKPLPDASARNTIVYGAAHDRHRWWVGSGERGVGWRTYALYADSPWLSGGRITPEPLPEWTDMPTLQRGHTRVIATVGCGWPMICLTAQQSGTDDTENEIARTGVIRSGLGPQAVLWDDRQRAIPLGPDDRGFIRRLEVLPFGVIWPGFLANAALFTVPWMLVLLLGPLRRLRRRQCGRCPRCGYDLRGDLMGGCTECGWGR